MLDQTHVMLDIETTDTKANSGIFQISAIQFIPQELKSLAGSTISELQKARPNGFNRYVQPLSFLGMSEFSVSQSTCKFIQKNNKQVFLTAVSDGSDFKEVLVSLMGWLKSSPTSIDHIWCKDASFDLTIIRHACSVFGVDDRALDFRTERSIRTIQELITYHNLPEFCIGTLEGTHDAAIDCILQINTVMRYLAWDPKL